MIGDVNKTIDVEQPVDYIFHCASVTASKYMVSNPVETVLTSVEGTKTFSIWQKKSNANQ